MVRTTINKLWQQRLGRESRFGRGRRRSFLMSLTSRYFVLVVIDRLQSVSFGVTYDRPPAVYQQPSCSDRTFRRSTRRSFGRTKRKGHLLESWTTLRTRTRTNVSLSLSDGPPVPTPGLPYDRIVSRLQAEAKRRGVNINLRGTSHPSRNRS